MKKWSAQAPGNIALIKYMGKSDSTNNTPINASLSYTLPELISFVELETSMAATDSWEPLLIPGTLPFNLTPASTDRFLAHLHFLKKLFSFSGNFIVRSRNNFPMGTGLASSASSFAALTMAAVDALCELTQQPRPAIETIAKLSQAGSGSSCRSFFAPWALWDDDGARLISDIPYTHLIHNAVVISHDVKAVSSSEAHSRVKSSPLFAKRKDTANQRLSDLLNALQKQDWAECYNLTKQEFLDMHQLFSTAQPAFSYLTKDSHFVLDQIQQHWDKHHDGPLVTMDAGPNVHLLFRPDQKEVAGSIKQSFIGIYDVI